MMKLVVILMCMGAAFAADGETSEGGVSVKVLGQSGKIQITTDGGKTITVEMDEMKELDKDGAEVGTSGSVKHSFNTFASQAFEFKPLVDDFVYNGLKTKKIEFSATNLAGTAKLTVPLLIFKESGNFTVGTTKYQVSEGNVKFNIELESWTFCGTTVADCKKGSVDEVGEYIVFVITVKGSGTAKEVPASEEKDGLKVYDLGENERLFMATEVKRDDTWEDMRAGFPKFEIQGSKQKFSFAIPRFINKVVYDPSFSAGTSPSSSVRISVTVATVLSALMAAVLLV